MVTESSINIIPLHQEHFRLEYWSITAGKITGWTVIMLPIMKTVFNYRQKKGTK